MTGDSTPEAAAARGESASSGDSAGSAGSGERIAAVRSLRPHRRRRARRNLLAEWPIALVLLTVAGGIALIAFASFRLGAVLIAVGVLLGFVLRISLSDAVAGMLVVRSRALDLSILGVLGVLLAVLAFLVPAPS